MLPSSSKRPAALVVVAALVGSLLAGCGGGAASPPSAAPQASKAGGAPAGGVPAGGAPAAAAPAANASAPTLSPVTFAWVGASPTSVPLWIAVDRGYFRDYGVDLKIVHVSPAIAVSGLVGGSVDIAGDGPGELRADPSGRNLAYIGALVNVFIFKLFAKTSIHTVAQLKGKTIATSTSAGPDTYAVRYILKHAGLNPNTDVKWLYMNSSTDAFAALEKGLVDASSIAFPEDVAAASDPKVHMLADAQAMGVPAAGLTLGVRRVWAQAHPQAVEGFLKGLIRGIAVARTDQAEAEKVMSKDIHIPQADIAEGYREFHAIWPDPPYMTTAAVQEAIGDSGNAQVLQHKPSDYLDNTYLDALVKSGFVAKYVPGYKPPAAG